MTTFAQEYVGEHGYTYVSADVIAESMDPHSIEDVRIGAGRAFLDRVAAQFGTAQSFVVETTLSGLTFERRIGDARDAGYEVSIVFIFVGSPEACVARIQERVSKGGHSVAKADVIRRFPRSIRNFWHMYRPLADRWHLFYNGGAHFLEVAVGEGDSFEVRDEGLFRLLLSAAGEERQ
jgi:predicted ABC-type ATPase